MTKIRHAIAADIDRIYELLLAIADYHGQSQYVRTNPGELLRSGFGDESNFGVLLAEDSDAIVGYASYTINYSIWLGEKYVNVDDVYVDKNFRGLGLGEKLMRELSKYCGSIDVSRLRWEVETDNREAIRFYERLGAKMTKKGVFSWDISR